MRKMNSYKNIIICLFSVIILGLSVTSCSNPAGNETESAVETKKGFSGNTFKSSDGYILQFFDEKSYEFDQTSSAYKLKGTYKISETDKTITLSPDSVYYKKKTLGDKTFFGKSYTKENFKDFLTEDYIPFLNYMIETYPDNKKEYEIERNAILKDDVIDTIVEVLTMVIFYEEKYEYSFNSDNKLVIHNGSENSIYTGETINNSNVINVYLLNNSVFVQVYEKDLWDWGDDSLYIKEGSVDTVNKTVTFNLATRGKEYKASYEESEDDGDITFIFDSSADFLAGKKVTKTGSEKNLIPFDDVENDISAIYLKSDDFKKGVEYSFGKDKESPEDNNYYLMNDEMTEIVNKSQYVKITRGKFGDETIDINFSEPINSTPVTLELDYNDYSIEIVFDL